MGVCSSNRYKYEIEFLHGHALYSEVSGGWSSTHILENIFVVTILIVFFCNEKHLDQRDEIIDKY